MTEIWTEKYRPRSLCEVVGHKSIKRIFQNYVTRQDMPNILLFGEPGVGKTALIRSFAHDFYGEYFAENFTEKNTSDDRGINFIRNEVKDFSNFAASGDFEFKMLYLGEMDGLTVPAQNALKRTIEKSAYTVRFIADCNNKDMLIPPIKSRFVRIYVGKPSKNEIFDHLTDILRKENIDVVSDKVLHQIIISTKADMRNSIQLLQALPLDGEDIIPEFVQELSPGVIPKDIHKLWSSIKEIRDPEIMEREQINVLGNSGWDAYGVLESLYESIYRSKGTPMIKVQLMDVIGEYLNRLSKPCNKIIQYRCCISTLRATLGVA